MSDELWVMSDEWWVMEIEWRKLSDHFLLAKQALRDQNPKETKQQEGQLDFHTICVHAKIKTLN